MRETYKNAPPVELALSVVRTEMSSTKRWLYRTLLAVVGALIAALITMWVTEPETLPPRTHVAFAALTAIGIGWIGVLTWLLVRRHDSTAGDRIATRWMATIACTVSLILSVAIALMRSNYWAALALAIVGLFLLGIALWLLRSSYALRADLLASLKEITKTTPILLCMIAGCVLLASDPLVGFADGGLATEETTMASRSGDRIPAEHRRLSVPVSHSKPQGQRLEIAFI